MPAVFRSRFLCLYLLLYIPTLGYFTLPYGRVVRDLFNRAIYPATSALADLCLPWVVQKPVATGSGDTSFDWAYLVLSLLVAALGALLWTLSRPEPTAVDLMQILRLFLRYMVGANLIAYGVVKFGGLQFPVPGAEQLGQLIGDSTPMNLLWVFMGSSPAYCAFSGCIEIGAGVALFFRRTTVFGACLGACAMTHVAVLNFAYDVPVKLFSCHLLLALLLLLYPARHRLIAVFTDRPVPEQPTATEEADVAVRLGKSRVWVKLLVILVLTAPSLSYVPVIVGSLTSPRPPTEFRLLRPGIPLLVEVPDR